MNEDLKIIKKYYGEKMMHFCREAFSTLLEEKGVLPKKLLENFNSNHSLFKDIAKYESTGDFKNYIYNIVKKAKANLKDISIRIDNPAKLLSDAGYNLFECKTEKDIQSFKKYYVPTEEICTFAGGRLNKCHVFFAIKKNVDEIKRKNFKNPSRQDEYGTSVISIQFTKDENCTLSIKNRYNNKVINSDATFSNDLDNIIEGLTESFKKHYGMKQKYSNEFDLPGYVRAGDGKHYKYNYEINNVYYCPNNIIIDNFQVKKLPKEKKIVMDYFILDLQEKNLKLYDKRINDFFLKSIVDIKKIEVKNVDGGKEIIIYNQEREVIVKITLDKNNNIIGLLNNIITKTGDYFLYYNKRLTSIDFPNLEQTGNYFLSCNEHLISINLPNLKQTGNYFLFNNQTLINFNFPNLEQTGDYFLALNKQNKCKGNIMEKDFFEEEELLSSLKSILNSLKEIYPSSKGIREEAMFEKSESANENAKVFSKNAKAFEPVF